jgi:iron complex outermembrane receptor protein
MSRPAHTAILLATLLAGSPVTASAQASHEATPSGLASLSFDELASLTVTSVSKRPEPWATAAASIFVITGEDIRRSGVTTLPEALRLAPNLHVAQASASSYAISARGLNGSNSSAPNKLLVMIDGRSVYSPLFSGVFWDVQDVVLEDVERIEVISGPGGTLWGVNAVNGVINVVTRRAQDTVGNLVAIGAGTDEAGGVFRHGRVLGEHGALRLSLSHRRHDNTRTLSGEAIDDEGERVRVGFRLDAPARGGWFTLTGAAYEVTEGQPEPGAIAISGVDLPLGDIDASGLNLLARWEHLDDQGAGTTLQFYFDRTRREVPPTFSQDLDIFDLQFQQGLQPLGRHRLTWGANARASRDRVTNSPWFAFLPASVDQQWVSIYGQDHIELTADARLVLGARIERNDYTGNEVLPNARWTWQVSPEHLLWSAWSRAVRAPSRLDRDAYIPGSAPFLLDGGHAVRSEVGNVAEFGYRGTWGKASFSATAFHADYDHLRTQEIAPSRTFVVFDSQMRGRVQGVELWAQVQPTTAWRLMGGLTVQDTVLELKPGSNDVAGPRAAGNDPSHFWQLRSIWNLGSDKEFDIVVRHVAELPRYQLEEHTSVDVRFGWRPHPGVELSLIGRNLGASHGEYRDVQYRSELEASGMAKVTWRF